MIFSAHDAFALMVIAAYLLTASFAWYLPLLVWWQDGRAALKWSMPVSWSIQIIIGYIFYSFTAVAWLIPSYFLVVAIINLVCVLRWHKRIPTLIEWPQLSPLCSVAAVLTLVMIVVVRLWDPLQTLAPGNNDTSNHLTFLYDLYQLGYLNNPYYAPGYHLLVGVLTQLIDQVSLYRWLGPVFSIIMSGGIYLFVRDYLKRPMLHWVYLVGSSSFLLHQWMLQTMSLFSSALTFLYLPVLLTLLMDTTFSLKRKVSVYALCSLALAVSVPYFFIQFVFVVIALFGLALWKKSLNMHKWYAAALVMTLLCIGVGLGHVYLQTGLLKRGGGFPEVPIVTKTVDNKVTLRSNFDETVTEHPDQPIQPVTPAAPNFSQWAIEQADQLQGFSWYNPVRPLILTAIDIISIKQLRSPATLLGAGAYIWLALSIVMLVLGLRRKQLAWVVVSTASIVFGFAIQTGSLEFSFYQGRSGWYLLWLALLGGCMLLDQYFKPNWMYPFLAVGAIAMVANVVYPPGFYRPYYTEVFDDTYASISANINPRPVIITQQSLLKLLLPEAVVVPLDISALTTLPVTERNRFLIIEKNYFKSDPVLSQQGLSGDHGYSYFYAQQTGNQATFERTKSAIEAAPEFADYTLIVENDILKLYRYTPAL